MINESKVFVSYVADGVQREWSCSFPYVEEDSIQLYVSHDGIMSKIPENLYAFDSERKIVTYPLGDLDPVPQEDIVLLWRCTNIDQLEDSTTTSFKSNDVERMEDKLTAICQELDDKLSRAIGYSPVDFYSDVYETDAGNWIATLKQYRDEAETFAGVAETAAAVATEAETNAQETLEKAITTKQEAETLTSELSSLASTAVDAYDKLNAWLLLEKAMTNVAAHFYVAGTAEEDYDGSLTSFPIESSSQYNFLVFVNGQYKQLDEEYTINSEALKLVFKNALRQGDRVQLIPFTVFASLEETDAFPALIADHNTNSEAHLSLRNTLTITRNGETAGTFTALNKTNATVDIAVPTTAQDVNAVSLTGNQTVNGTKSFSEVTYGKTPSDVAVGNELVTAAWARKNAGGSGSGGSASLPLFTYDWFDHISSEDANWVRSDNYLWLSGELYSSAYQHLAADLQNATATQENINGNVITYYRATDGHKIILPAMATMADTIFADQHEAWYYLVDTANSRFKLPRRDYQSSDTQELEQHKYLYFYLGAKIVNASEIDAAAILNALNQKVDVPDMTNSGSVSGTVQLATNTIYTMAISGTITFSLPSAVDTNKYNQIKIMAKVTGNPTVNWGTTHFIKKTVPDLSEGYYDFYFDYDNNLNDWVVGTVVKG